MRAPAELLEEARGGSRAALARLLSYVEGGGEALRATAALAYRTPVPYVVGLTGPPGAGKSTLTDQYIAAVLAARPEGEGRLGVLCVDPTSPFTGGAILGDRIRMQAHATDDRVFIRSMATRGHLGGLSLAVPDAVRVLGATGSARVLVETVGVGQMEVDIASAADTTVVVTNPGWGDAMQANKAGLLEVADVFVINKADRAGVRETRRDLEQMLDLGGARDWRPPIVETVATSGEGIAGLLEALDAHRAHLDGAGLVDRRRAHVRAQLEAVVAAALRERAAARAAGAALEAAVELLLESRGDPYGAAETLLSDP